MTPAISVVVVAYRQRALLAECLRSVAAAAASVPGGVELIVVDNGGLAGLVREQAREAIVIEPGENVGFAAAVSRGLEAASGEWVALVNDDARIEPAALTRLLAAAERDARIGSVAAQVRFEADPDRINSAGIEVDSLGVATERLAGRPIAAAQEPAEVFGASASFALYRAAMLDAVGGLDARFFAYLEDVDLAWRARAAGWTSVYEPSAIGYHHGSASSGEGTRTKYFLVGRNRVRLLARNATTAQLLRALPGLVLYEPAYTVYAALTDRTLAPLRGRLAGARDWSSYRKENRPQRQPVPLRPFVRAAFEGWRMHRAYRQLGSRV